MVKSIWHAYQFFQDQFNRLFNRVLFYLYRVEYAEFPSTKGRIMMRNLGRFSIGNKTTLNSQPGSIPLGRASCIFIQVSEAATLTIGSGVGITSSTIHCSLSIVIEDDVFIGEGCRIADTDFHSLRLEDRKSEKFGIYQNINNAPVIICNGSFIGAGVIILKGVRIGERSVIGAGSVVSKSIPPGQVWAGNPARYLRDLSSNEL